MTSGQVASNTLRPALFGLGTYLLGHAVCAEDDGAAVRDLAQFIDEHRTTFAQALDDEPVVHHLVAYVDGRAEGIQCAFHDLDRAIDAGTEAAWVGQYYFHARIVRGCGAFQAQT